MRTHTSEFKEKIKLFGRQIKGKIIYYPSYDLISEGNDNILTEANLQLISEQANYDDPIEINEENIFSISIIKNGDLLQSLMKEFDFEAKDEFNIGSVVNPHFGLLVDDENQTYEYLDYGNYIVNSKEFNMDTQTWSYVCYDKMLFAMVKYRPLANVTYPITIKQYINLICNKIGLEFKDSNFVNQDQLIYEDLYKDKGLTYRDVFDEISKIVAGNLLINDNDKLEVGYPKQASYSENASGSDIIIEAVEEPISDVKLEGDTQQNTSILPSGYTQVDYIQSSGGQYIDTGFNVTPNTKVETIFAYTQVTPTQQRIFGTNNPDTNGMVFTTYINGNGYFAWASQNNTGNWTSTGITGDTNKHIFSIDNLNNLVSLDSYSTSITTTRTNTSASTLLLFSIRNNGNPTNFSYLKLYSTKIYDNNVLVRDFIPCYRNSDNVVGLYDLVNDVFYTNQGSGAFTYGSVVNIPNPDYPQEIETVTGEQNIQITNNNVTTNYQISLGEIELCRIGNYQDYIYKNNGDWYLHKKIGKVILNGGSNESYVYQNNHRFWLRRQYWTNETVPFNPPQNALQGLYCNRFTERTRSQTWAGIEGISYDNPNTTDQPIGSTFTIACNSVATNENDFKTWLSSNNLIVYYILQNLQDTQITDTTLIQQLDNLKNATLYNGVNNIIVSGDLPSILNLDYISEYESINEDYLKDTNVIMAEKFGVINSVAVLDTDNDLQYIAEDTQSIKENELTRITITDNLIALNGDTQTIADNVLNKLNGLYYYINDLTTTGVCYYDFLDMFHVEARGNVYQCLLLNNEITISQGIEEQIFTERLEESETSANEYTTSVMTNKQVQFKINQQEGKIESKVEKDGVISAINQSAEEIQIQANKLSFEGAIIDMTADNIRIKGENLDIDSDGMITLTDNTADESQIKNASYKIESNYDDEYQGETVHVGYVHEIFANGRKNEYENDNNIQGSSGYGHYLGGIDENLYRYPRSTWYMKSDDYVEGYTYGTYTGLAVGVQGINSTIISNGTATYPLDIETDGRITCVSVTQTSKEENKKNFEKLTNAKKILSDTDIYKYNMIDEEDETKKHIGFIIGDNFNYSQDITSVENNGVDIYSMVSVLWQAVKEQQEEINELKEVIKNGKY